MIFENSQTSHLLHKHTGPTRIHTFSYPVCVCRRSGWNRYWPTVGDTEPDRGSVLRTGSSWGGLGSLRSCYWAEKWYLWIRQSTNTHTFILLEKSFTCHLNVVTERKKVMNHQLTEWTEHSLGWWSHWTECRTTPEPHPGPTRTENTQEKINWQLKQARSKGELMLAHEKEPTIPSSPWKRTAMPCLSFSLVDLDTISQLLLNMESCTCAEKQNKSMTWWKLKDTKMAVKFAGNHLRDSWNIVALIREANSYIIFILLLFDHMSACICDISVQHFSVRDIAQ